MIAHQASTTASRFESAGITRE